MLKQKQYKIKNKEAKIAIEVFILNAFAKTANGGNPAGVVLNSNLSDIQMLNIAKEVGFSETAFLNKTGEKSYEAKYFTPAAEVDLCGHATVAAFSLLKLKKLITNGTYFLNTKAGPINLNVNDNNIFMTQKLPEFSEILSSDEISDCLNIKNDDLITDLHHLPLQVVSTGLRDIIVPIKNLKTLLSMQPNFDKITELSRKYNTIGLHAFSLETMFNSTAHCRNFAPLYDVPEESATGTASGALASYLFKYKLINSINAKNIIFEQGYIMDKPSEILVNLDTENNNILAVNVGGSALISRSKILML